MIMQMRVVVSGLGLVSMLLGLALLLHCLRCRGRRQLGLDVGPATVAGLPTLARLHVINVADKRGLPRRKALASALAGLDWVLVDARLKDDVSAANLAAVHALQRAWLAHPRNTARKSHYPLTKGEVALSLSHAEVYRDLLSGSAEPYRLVAEDDIRVCPGFASCLAGLLQRLPSDFDWLKIEYIDGETGGLEKQRLRRPEECAIEAYDAYATPLHCTALYLVSRAGAAHLLAANGQGRTWLPADGAMDAYWLGVCTGDCRAGRAYRVVPQLAWQDLGFGDVGSHRGLAT